MHLWRWPISHCVDIAWVHLISCMAPLASSLDTARVFVQKQKAAKEEQRAGGGCATSTMAKGFAKYMNGATQ